MPKKKSHKILSLVSAYESDAESEEASEGSGNNEEDHDDEDDEEKVAAADDNTKSERSATPSGEQSSSDQQPATTTSVKKRRPSDEFDENMSGDEMREDSTTAEEDGNDDDDDDEPMAVGGAPESATATVGDVEAAVGEATAVGSPPATHVDSQSIYTIENGFPPGCQNLRLPPAPKAQCSQALQNKIVQVINQMQHYNMNYNEDYIKKKKSFKNPSIYEKLIEGNQIDEFGSSFPGHIEDLKEHGYMFYDELDAAQKAEWAQKAKEKKDRTKIEMVTATKKK